MCLVITDVTAVYHRHDYLYNRPSGTFYNSRSLTRRLRALNLFGYQCFLITSALFCHSLSSLSPPPSTTFNTTPRQFHYITVIYFLVINYIFYLYLYIYLFKSIFWPVHHCPPIIFIELISNSIPFIGKQYYVLFVLL